MWMIMDIIVLKKFSEYIHHQSSKILLFILHYTILLNFYCSLECITTV